MWVTEVTRGYFDMALEGSFTDHALRVLFDEYGEGDDLEPFDPEQIKASWKEYTAKEFCAKFGPEYGITGPLYHAANSLFYEMEKDKKRSVFATKGCTYLVEVLKDDGEMTLSQFRDWVESGDADRAFTNDGEEPTEDDVIEDARDAIVDIADRHMTHCDWVWTIAKENARMLAEDLSSLLTKCHRDLMSANYESFLQDYAAKLSPNDRKAAESIIDDAVAIFNEERRLDGVFVNAALTEEG